VLSHLDELSKQRYVAPYNFALIHLGLTHGSDSAACIVDNIILDAKFLRGSTSVECDIDIPGCYSR
jgi:hypothetical protein